MQPDAAHRGHPGRWIIGPDSDLGGPESRLARRQHSLDLVSRSPPLCERRVAGELVQRTAKQRRYRLAARLPGDVPQRRLKRPVPAGVHRDLIERPDVPGDPQRIGADEQLGVALEPVHRVTRAVTGDALVGSHDDQSRIEVPAGYGIPGWAERRVER